jgi:hypothetical protein
MTPAQIERARLRANAWRRIVEIVADMRDGLRYRIWREDPADEHLEHDCELFCELARALGAFLRIGRR